MTRPPSPRVSTRGKNQSRREPACPPKLRSSVGGVGGHLGGPKLRSAYGQNAKPRRRSGGVSGLSLVLAQPSRAFILRIRSRLLATHEFPRFMSNCWLAAGGGWVVNSSALSEPWPRVHQRGPRLTPGGVFSMRKPPCYVAPSPACGGEPLAVFARLHTREDNPPPLFDACQNTRSIVRT